MRQLGGHHWQPALPEPGRAVLPARVEFHRGLRGGGHVLLVGRECAVLFPEPEVAEKGCHGGRAVPPMSLQGVDDDVRVLWVQRIIEWNGEGDARRLSLLQNRYPDAEYVTNTNGTGVEDIQTLRC